MFFSIDKQTKNRNGTGSNLSLGTRLTVMSKRLGRKRCCDATPDRCLGGVSSHYLCFALKKKSLCSSKDRGFWHPKAWRVPNEKMNTLNVDACTLINSLPKVQFFRLERFHQTSKKWKLAFQKYKLSDSFFKMQLQNCIFPNFNLQILFSKSNLRSSFANLSNFKFSKLIEKVQNYIK